MTTIVSNRPTFDLMSDFILNSAQLLTYLDILKKKTPLTRLHLHLRCFTNKTGQWQQWDSFTTETCLFSKFAVSHIIPVCPEVVTIM